MTIKKENMLLNRAPYSGIKSSKNGIMPNTIGKNEQVVIIFAIKKMEAILYP
jgi:hypothetical protein